LPGDGIGPEVIGEARRALLAIAERFGHNFSFAEAPVGGVAIDAFGDPLPPATVDICRRADAVVLGAVGGPRWDDPDAAIRPEQGLLRLRKELGLFANLRPITVHPALAESSPLRTEIVSGVDILFVRELTGGIYFGPSFLAEDGSEAGDTMRYSIAEVERIVRLAGEAARTRRGRVTSVDKANVLEVSRLWRRVAARVMREEFPDVAYDVVLVDAMAMYLLARPADFDVVVTGNLFGDILTDEASMLPGSLGLLPSASLGSGGPGLYEPVHGSAPNLAGHGVANPLATILAAAMALRHSLGMPAEAAALEAAVDNTLEAGMRTADLAAGDPPVSTGDMGSAVVARVLGS
jgi:3-isopropylmalate dehydrogenase